MRPLRIGTRGSPLALIQTHEVIAGLAAHHPMLTVEIVPIKTTGDTIVDRSLIDMGGKSLFTKEIEQALLKGEIDLAVHSMKDVTADVPEGLIIPSMLKREDPRDALITYKHKPLEELPTGAIFGTSSLRRQAYVLHKYPHMAVVSLRGNVATRLEKVEKGEVAATLLAVAGLKRLGLLDKATQVLDLDKFLPAVAQGAIGIQCRTDDECSLDCLASLNHLPTFQAVSAERAFMKALNGSCRTPMAGYGYLEGDTLMFNGMVSDPQGQEMHSVSHSGPASDAVRIGEEAACKIKGKPCAASS